MHLNRRQVVRSALLTVASFAPLSHLQSLAWADNTDSAPSPNQTLFQPMESSTFTLLDKHFPGFRTLPSTSWLLPFTAVIKNGGKTSVKAYKFRWVTNQGHSEETLLTAFFTSRASIAKHSAIATGWNTILKPGEYALVTPLFVRSASKYFRHGRGAIPLNRLLMGQDRGATFIGTVDPTASIRVRRDLKICRYAAFGRPTHAVKLYEATVNYERSLAGAIISSSRNAGGLQEAVATLLAEMKSRPVSVSSRVKCQYLESVQARIEHFDSDVAFSSVQRIARLPKLALVSKSRSHA